MDRERYVRHAAAVARRVHAGGWRYGSASVAVAALALALGAAAPAAAGPNDADLLARSTPCCEDPSRFAFDALPARGDLDFAIDRRSPVFEFQSGRSYFRAFRLPSEGPAYVLELRSFLDEPGSPRSARMFVPVMAILTDDFLVSRATDLDALRFDLPMLERTTAPAYRVQLPIDPANTRERYVVVFTPAQLVEARDLQVTNPDTAAQAARTAYLGASAFGKLRFTVRPGSAAEAVEPTDAPAEEEDAPEDEAPEAPDAPRGASPETPR
jgi:hypothetical protein